MTAYPSVIRPQGQPIPETNQLVALNLDASLPVLALMGRDLEGDEDFALTRNGDTVRAEKTLSNGLRVVKEFEIRHQLSVQGARAFGEHVAQAVAGARPRTGHRHGHGHRPAG